MRRRLITDRRHHRAMYTALSRSHPDEVRSMRSYPRQQQLAELEARYTAESHLEGFSPIWVMFSNGCAV